MSTASSGQRWWQERHGGGGSAAAAIPHRAPGDPRAQPVPPSLHDGRHREPASASRSTAPSPPRPRPTSSSAPRVRGIDDGTLFPQSVAWPGGARKRAADPLVGRDRAADGFDPQRYRPGSRMTGPSAATHGRVVSAGAGCPPATTARQRGFPDALRRWRRRALVAAGPFLPWARGDAPSRPGLAGGSNDVVHRRPGRCVIESAARKHGRRPRLLAQRAPTPVVRHVAVRARRPLAPCRASSCERRPAGRGERAAMRRSGADTGSRSRHPLVRRVGAAARPR
jgi:hypothetical protein